MTTIAETCWWLREALRHDEFVGVPAPALAADTMMLDKGKSIMIEPDGSMTMLPAMKTPVDPEMAKASKPFTTCTIIMKGDDGKLYSVEDMKMKDGKMVCDAMKGM